MHSVELQSVAVLALVAHALRLVGWLKHVHLFFLFLAYLGWSAHGRLLDKVTLQDVARGVTRHPLVPVHLSSKDFQAGILPLLWLLLLQREAGKHSVLTDDVNGVCRLWCQLGEGDVLHMQRWAQYAPRLC